jgi:hypothetical protein
MTHTYIYDNQLSIITIFLTRTTATQMSTVRSVTFRMKLQDHSQWLDLVLLVFKLWVLLLES